MADPTKKEKPNLNQDEFHSFIKGWQKDLENHAERSESFDDAKNMRLYSINGTMALSALPGTREVYNNVEIKRYLGYWGFKDELIVFVKAETSLSEIEYETKTITEVTVQNFEVSAGPLENTITGVSFDGKYNQFDIDIQVPIIIANPDDFNQNVSDVPNTNTIDATFNGLFIPSAFIPNTACPLNENNPNGGEYKDAILSFKYNDQNELVGNYIWVGYLNIPINAKITCIGVDENIFYKRVYFSDYFNPTRTVNVLDKNLLNRTPEEFNIQSEGVLLNPRIKSVDIGGVLKAMTTFYLMRLITDNGQVTDYSALSKGVKIGPSSPLDILTGGKTSDVTDKSVTVQCLIPNYKKYAQVELIAIEYLAQDAPSALRLVGNKKAEEIVEFTHIGNETEYTDITIGELVANTIDWKYNSDFEAFNNKLVKVGLRNDPYYVDSKNADLDFSFSSFDENGNTHTCLLNPDPKTFRFIDNEMTTPVFYVKRKLIKKVSAFGDFKMTLINKNTGDYYEFEQPIVNYKYVDFSVEIAQFIMDSQTDDAFNTKFPNLVVTVVNGKILFSPIDEDIKTDFRFYTLEFNTKQVIVDYDSDIKPNDIEWPITDEEKNSRLVYGAVSNGWFNGNGIRVTMKTQSEPILSKNTDWMSAGQLPLQIINPSMAKGFMKGEIYRLGIQWFKNGNKLFTTVLGDIKMPEIGMPIRQLESDGSIVFNSTKVYENKTVIGDTMYANRIQLDFDVRLNCQITKEVDSYQIVYVERTEENRTILAQGISAPLERIQTYLNSSTSDINIPEALVQKWMLPTHGGPVYDSNGLELYDENANQTILDFDTTLPSNRFITSRKNIYFDSPDFIFQKISSRFSKTASLEFIESVCSDHDRFNILCGYNPDTVGNDSTDVYLPDGSHGDHLTCPFGNPKFSQKIPHKLIAGEPNDTPWFINVSVFSNTLKKRTYLDFQTEINEEFTFVVDAALEAKDGDVVSAFRMKESFDVSNNAIVLPSHGFWYIRATRLPMSDDPPIRTSLVTTNNIASGRNTLFLKTNTDFFKNDIINQNSFVVNARYNNAPSNYSYGQIKANDSYIISNLKRDNADAIYGGRTEFAYANNIYIPLSDVIPVIDSYVASQKITVEGDTYTSLFIRNKTSFIKGKKPELIRYNLGDTRRAEYNRYGAWCYATVLETTVEPKLTTMEDFYKLTDAIGFKYEEMYNTAYLQENTLKKSIPRPYNFQDNPIGDNMVAVSKTKLNGDYYDAWVKFPTNEFYELDRNKGAALNIVKEESKMYVAQELQTSEIFFDERAFITPDNNGKAIQVNQGNGKSISGHRVVSEYGTSFRRAIVRSPFGFSFFDERKHEFVKIVEPLFLKNNLLLSLKEVFNALPVVDVEGYYDEKYKETNIRFRTQNGSGYVISYNELFKVFNGKYDYNNDLYMMFQNKVITPYEQSQKLGELNSGDKLIFFETQKIASLRVISAPAFTDTKINKGISIYTDIHYPITRVEFITSLGPTRSVQGTHHWYKIREGVHTIPAKNATDYTDIRGEWCSIEIFLQSINNSNINVFGLINHYRKSNK